MIKFIDEGRAQLKSTPQFLVIVTFIILYWHAGYTTVAMSKQDFFDKETKILFPCYCIFNAIFTDSATDSAIP
jgi:hypothetical protein